MRFTVYAPAAARQRGCCRIIIPFIHPPAGEINPMPFRGNFPFIRPQKYYNSVYENRLTDTRI